MEDKKEQNLPETQEIEQESVGNVSSLNDDPTCVKATILVLCTVNDNDAPFLRLALRSLQNLRGIDADVKVCGRNKPTWLPHEDFISVPYEKDETDNDIIRKALSVITDERIVLMTDRMMIANPITLADIALLKALPDVPNATTELLMSKHGVAKANNYETNMPLYAFRKQLLEVMNWVRLWDFKNYDIATMYNNAIFPDIKPVYVYWAKDQWLLPIVSAAPAKAVVMKYVEQGKKFIHCTSVTPRVLEVLSPLFPTPSPCELDTKNED